MVSNVVRDGVTGNAETPGTELPGERDAIDDCILLIEDCSSWVR